VHERAFTITSKGQVTIPQSIREKMGVRPGDKVRFREEGGKIRLVPVKRSLADVLGSVKPVRPGTDVEELIRIAKEERAVAFAKKLRRQTR
jgi:antitoxin PrlF